MTTTFVQFNNNPKGLKTSDCAIRALSKATGKSWDEVFYDLVQIAKELKTTQTSIATIANYLSKYSKVDIYKLVNGKRKRMTVKDICNLNGTFVIQTANHLTTVVDGKYYDLFDSGNKCAYRIWRLK